MPKRRSNAEVPSSLDRLGLFPSHEHLQSLYLDTYKQLFQDDSTTTYAPFMALASVAAYWWQSKEAPGERVEVAWWALEAIAYAFNDYMQDFDDGKSTRFGEAFGMEGRRQGKKPTLNKVRKLERDRHIALHIAISVEGGASVEEAVNDVAEQFKLSDKAVWRVWGELGDDAKESLARHRTLNSSRSSDRDLATDAVPTPAERGQRRPRTDRKASKRGTQSIRSRSKIKR
jgi:hypothetical protein